MTAVTLFACLGLFGPAVPAPVEAVRPTAYVPPAPSPPRGPEDDRAEEEAALAALPPNLAERSRIRNRVGSALNRLPRRRDIEVHVKDDIITIDGWVTGRDMKVEVERIVRDFANGRPVESRLVAIRMSPVVAAKPAALRD